jgi:SSS family solute:Na+ symporter/sodium/proline symporter
MFIALVMVPVVAFGALDQPTQLLDTIEQLNPKHLDLFTGTSVLGIISLLAWGLGYFGQPHIIVRFMAIRSVDDFKMARRIGMSWMIISILGAMAIGFIGIAYIHQTKMPLQDPETIFILLSQVLFHPFVGGLLLAAILAAIMSTVSSQLLVTSSALTQDFYKTFLHKAATDQQQVLIGRLSVFAVALVAIGLALDSSSSILGLVANAWAGFGAAFGPVVLLSLYWRRMNHWGALAGIITGALTVLFWAYSPYQIDGKQLNDYLYAMIPGVFISALCTWLVSLATAAPTKDVALLFQHVSDQLDSH